jgi:hypothetical protein
MARDRKISELARIEFTGPLGAAFKDYSDELSALGQRWRFELDMAASDFQAAASTLRGHPLLLGVDVRMKARRVAKRLKRAQDLAYGLSEEGRKFHRDYVKNFRDRAGRR